MRIAIGSDHGGFPIKEAVLETVRNAGHEIIDFGTSTADSVDYPEFAVKVGGAIQAGEADRGILLCGTGIGICITANKMNGIYAAVCHDAYSARQGVEHDDMNVLCLGGRILGAELVKILVTEFLDARFVGNDPGGERHKRRTDKVKMIEKGDFTT